MHFAKFSLYSVATSCWTQYSFSGTSKDKKFVINSLRLCAGTISLNKMGPTILRREILHQTVVSVKIFLEKCGNLRG